MSTKEYKFAIYSFFHGEQNDSENKKIWLQAGVGGHLLLFLLTRLTYQHLKGNSLAYNFLNRFKLFVFLCFRLFFHFTAIQSKAQQKAYSITRKIESIVLQKYLECTEWLICSIKCEISWSQLEWENLCLLYWFNVVTEK